LTSDICKWASTTKPCTPYHHDHFHRQPPPRQCSPSSRPDFNETPPDRNPMLRRFAPCMGLTMFNLSEVVPCTNHVQLFPALTMFNCSRGQPSRVSTSERCHMLSPYRSAPRRGATRLAPGEERSDVTWGWTCADDLTPGLEEGEHGYRVSTSERCHTVSPR